MDYDHPEWELQTETNIYNFTFEEDLNQLRQLLQNRNKKLEDQRRFDLGASAKEDFLTTYIEGLKEAKGIERATDRPTKLSKFVDKFGNFVENRKDFVTRMKEGKKKLKKQRDRKMMIMRRRRMRRKMKSLRMMRTTTSMRMTRKSS